MGSIKFRLKVSAFFRQVGSQAGRQASKREAGTQPDAHIAQHKQLNYCHQCKQMRLICLVANQSFCDRSSGKSGANKQLSSKPEYICK